MRQSVWVLKVLCQAQSRVKLRAQSTSKGRAIVDQLIIHCKTIKQEVSEDFVRVSKCIFTNLRVRSCDNVDIILRRRRSER